MSVIRGDGPAPSLVLALVQGLPDTSLTVALASGGREFFGWGQDRYMIADLFDAMNANTRSTGQWKKGKEPKFQPYPRPKSKDAAKKKPKRPTSVADVFEKFMNMK